jgi:hypothetical protein
LSSSPPFLNFDVNAAHSCLAHAPATCQHNTQLSENKSAHQRKRCLGIYRSRQMGTWCNGITPVYHAAGPWTNPQCVHFCLAASTVEGLATFMRLLTTIKRTSVVTSLFDTASSRELTIPARSYAEKQTNASIWLREIDIHICNNMHAPLAQWLERWSYEP